jgi:hypothetical protein
MNRHDSAAELPERIGAELDGALAALSDRDRGAVMLRYLNGMSVGETAAALCVSPEAAGKRIARALERLRQRLLRRGVIVPALGMAAALQGIPHFSATPALAGAVASSSLIPAASTAPAAIAKGTVQLMNWIKLKIAATILISAAVAAAATGTVALLQQSPAPADPAPAAPAPANPPPAATGAAGTFKVVLANGVSFELLGIAENPSRGKAWWKADGSPLSSPPYSRFDARMDAPNQLVREVAVLINPALIQASLPADVRWNLVGNGSRSSADPHPAVKGLEASAFIVADDPAGCTVRATVAAGEWATQYTIDGFGNHSESHAGPFGLGKKSFLCGPAITDHGKTRITAVSSGLGGDDLDVRMVAIDDTGRTYPAQTTGFISDSAVIIGEFLSDLPPASIKQWEFQTRPFDQWIEIRHVAVHPGRIPLCRSLPVMGDERLTGQRLPPLPVFRGRVGVGASSLRRVISIHIPANLAPILHLGPPPEYQGRSSIRSSAENRDTHWIAPSLADPALLCCNALITEVEVHGVEISFP